MAIVIAIRDCPIRIAATGVVELEVNATIAITVVVGDFALIELRR